MVNKKFKEKILSVCTLLYVIIFTVCVLDILFTPVGLTIGERVILVAMLLVMTNLLVITVMLIKMFEKFKIELV